MELALLLCLHLRHQFGPIRLLFLLDVSVDDLPDEALLVRKQLQVQSFYSADDFHFSLELGPELFVLLAKCLDHVNDLLHDDPCGRLVLGPFHELFLVVLAH